MRFHPLASKDYLKAIRSYERESERAAERFIAAVDVALEQISDNPLLWPKYDERFRWISLRRFPYILYFEILDDTPIQIIAVAHKSRKPGYWKRRAKKR
ncbi:MAG: type II toxin-antitoxin system RelE/ParE family toxin [Planctomycetes bacterium]|nr:type II toxin-antitoxin system RelE/ParE family toxin [Planctomycetota bacterium]